MFGLYSSACIPIVATNLLFYSVTSLSTSISSSQTVVRFITEHKDCDSIVFKNELVDMDLENKLQILEALVCDILCKFTLEKKEKGTLEKIKKEFRNPGSCVTDAPHPEWLDVTEVKVHANTEMATVLDRIDEPLKLALLSTADTLQQIATLLQDIRKKIDDHDNSLMKRFVSLSLKTELSRLHKHVKVLDIRTHLLLDLLPIYLPRGKGSGERRG